MQTSKMSNMLKLKYLIIFNSVYHINCLICVTCKGGYDATNCIAGSSEVNCTTTNALNSELIQRKSSLKFNCIRVNYKHHKEVTYYMGCAGNFDEYDYCKETIESMIPQLRHKYSCAECHYDKCNNRVIEFTNWNFKMSAAGLISSMKSLLILEIILYMWISVAFAF